VTGLPSALRGASVDRRDPNGGSGRPSVPRARVPGRSRTGRRRGGFVKRCSGGTTPTGSIPSAATPTIARPWLSPSRAVCAPSSPTATSGSASSTAARACGSRPASTSPRRRRCTARGTCGSGSMRPWRHWPRANEACQQRSRRRTERPQRASGPELVALSLGAATPRSWWLVLEGGPLVDGIRLRAVRGGE
jgi:hypothetical protein